MPNPTYKFTNGYDAAKVIPELIKRVKWKVDATSDSGRFFDDNSFHALLTEKNWMDVQDDTTSSAADKRAAFVKSAVARALNSVFSKKSAVIERKKALDVSVLRGVAAGLPDSDFHGFEITVAEDGGNLVKIDNVQCRFTANTDVKFYVFAEGDSEPFFEETKQIIGGKISVVSLTDCYLSYANTKNRRFYFGYKPSELQNGSLPVKLEVDCHHSACIYQATLVNTPAAPIVDDDVQYPSYAYGINIEMTSLYDHTENILASPQIFDELIGLNGAAMVLEKIIYTTRKNETERTLSQGAEFGAQMDLTGVMPASDSPRIEGIRARIKKEVEAVQRSFDKKRSGVVNYARN